MQLRDLEEFDFGAIAPPGTPRGTYLVQRIVSHGQKNVFYAYRVRSSIRTAICTTTTDWRVARYLECVIFIRKTRHQPRRDRPSQCMTHHQLDFYYFSGPRGENRSPGAGSGAVGLVCLLACLLAFRTFCRWAAGRRDLYTNRWASVG